MVEGPYLHGFTQNEQQRLMDQALFLKDWVYRDIDFSGIENLLEIGSGVGAQTIILLKKFPSLKITGIDFSEVQLKTAHANLNLYPELKGRYEFKKMNAGSMEFEEGVFEGVFLCWVLEHVNNAQEVLKEAYRVLIPGGKLVASEVFNHTFYTFPECPNLRHFWNQYNAYQSKAGGDPNIGIKLVNLLNVAGFKDINLTVRSFIADNRDVKRKREITDYWTDLLLSGAESLIKAGLVKLDIIEDVKREFLEIANHPEGVFYCSFIQAKAEK